MKYSSLGILSIALALFVSACDGDGRPFTEAVEVRTLNLQSLSVLPPTNSQDTIYLNPNEGLQFSIRGLNGEQEGIFLSANDRAWSVDEPSVATISDSGFLTAIADGSVNVSVSVGGLASSTFPVIVSTATLTAISEISGSSELERCIPGSYYATGTFSDSTVRNLSSVVWSLNNTSVNTAIPAQLFETNGSSTRVNGFQNSDTLQITASVEGVEDFIKALSIQNNLVSIAIGPGPIPIQIDEGDELNLNVLATYTRETADNTSTTSQSTITENVEWSMVSGTNNATINNTRGSRGLLTGVDEGDATVLVQCGSVTNRAAIDIDTAGTNSTSSTLSFQVNNVAVGSSLVLNRATTSTVIPLRVSTGSSYDADDDITENIDFVTQFVGTNLENPPFEIMGSGADRTIRLLGAGQGVISATETTEGEPTVTLTITVE